MVIFKIYKYILRCLWIRNIWNTFKYTCS